MTAAASYVTVVCDLRDGQGRQLSRGQAIFRPSRELTDVPDMQIVPPAAALAEFAPRATPSVMLLASDSPGPQPYGWTWDAEFSVPGGLEPRSVYVPGGPVAFTATQGGPAVFTWTPDTSPWGLQSLPVGTGVQLSGDSLPGGFSAGATYWVASSSGVTVQLAATQGGPPLTSLTVGWGQLSVVQYQLSGLTTVECAADLSGYLQRPAGTPSAGLVPVATGYGDGTEWGELAPADVGALPVTGGTVEGELSPTVTTLTYSSTVPVNAELGNVFALTMTGACTLANPAGGTDGQAIRLRVTSNGHSLTFGAAYLFGTAGQPSLSSSGLDVLGFEFIEALPGWAFLGGGGQAFAP